MKKDRQYYKLHIFSPGTHKSSTGHTCTISKTDLQNTANNFISNHRVPLCLGHSSFKHKDIIPSLGWFRDVKQDEDGELYGLVEATKAGEALIEGGYYENFSASFYDPQSDLNPKPGNWTLRHVAALGGEPPALKELDPLLAVLPQDFSEVQNFETWYEFKEVDASQYVEFSDGSTRLLPNTYDFKSFRTFGKKLRCKAGQKQCGGRCIPNNWKCKDSSSSRFKPGTTSNYKKPKKDVPSSTKNNDGTAKKGFLPKEEYIKQKNEEKQQQKKKETKKKLTRSAIKGLAALGVTMGAQYLTSKDSFPKNPQAKQVVNILAGVAADQFLLQDTVNWSDRATTAAYSALEGTIEEGIRSSLDGNAYAGTMAKATTGMLSTVMLDSGLIDLKYDGYARKMYKSANTLQSALKDAAEWKRNTKKKNSLVAEIEESGKAAEERIKRAAAESITNQDDIDASLRSAKSDASLAVQSAAQAAGAAKRGKQYTDESLYSMIEILLSQGIDPDGAMEKLRDLQIALETNDPAIRQRLSRRGADFMDYSVMSDRDRNTKYVNSDIPISFSTKELNALMLPLVLSILKYKKLYTDEDVRLAKTRTVKSGRPELDATFSELSNAKTILKHNVSNVELQEALFGPKRISDDFNDGDTDFSEDDGTVEDKRRRRRRRRKLGNKQSNFSEQKPRKLNIDVLLDDAFDFAEGKNVKKSKPKNKKHRATKPRSNHGGGRHLDFKERGNRRVKIKRKTSRNTMDFSESPEYQRLTKELAEERRQKRRMEVANFAETVYADGKLTQGIVKKDTLIDLLLGCEDNDRNFEFSEDGVENASGILRHILENITPMVSFSEVVTGSDIIPQPVFEEGYDIESQKLDRKITEYMTANPTVTYEEAWAKVAGRVQ
jgi:hypothetical protein